MDTVDPILKQFKDTHAEYAKRKFLRFDVCVVHRRWTRMLSGKVAHQPCLPPLDCQPHYYALRSDDPELRRMTWIRAWHLREAEKAAFHRHVREAQKAEVDRRLMWSSS